MDYFYHLGILVCIFTILAQSYSLVAGYAGQFSLTHAAFFGIGAYTSAILSINYSASIFFAFPLSIVCSIVFAFLTAIVAARTVDDYYIIITLAVQIVLYSLFSNWQSVTRGPLGVANIPDIEVFGRRIENGVVYFLFSVATVFLNWRFLEMLTRSPYGRILRALSEDEVLVACFGKNVKRAKVSSFVIGSVGASTAGVLYAHYMGYIGPDSFSTDVSIFILSIIILGGVRNFKGIFFAACFLVLFPELLRFVGIPSSTAANLREIVYGAILILAVYRMAREYFPLPS